MKHKPPLAIWGCARTEAHRGHSLPLLLLVACWALLPPASSNLSAQEDWGAIEIMGSELEAGTSGRFLFFREQTYQASFLNSQLFVARGNRPGPTLCLTAGIHGDELNGVEVARRTFAAVDASRLNGTLIVLPAINAAGVRTGDRYLPDRRDLNRAFPGSKGGSIAALLAYAVSSKVLLHCEFLVDLHTGSDQRSNLPQIRADLSSPATLELAIHFGRGLVVDGKGPNGSLRRAAEDAGIPAVIYEAGGPDQFQEQEIEHGKEGVFNVMAYLGMVNAPIHAIPESRIFNKTRWVRAGKDQSGYFFPAVKLGDAVQPGEVLGRVIDPYSNSVAEIISPIAGEVIGMAVSRPVLSGYGLFHLAWKK